MAEGAREGRRALCCLQCQGWEWEDQKQLRRGERTGAQALESQTCYFLAVYPWTSYLTSLSLHFLPCNTWEIVPLQSHYQTEKMFEELLAHGCCLPFTSPQTPVSGLLKAKRSEFTVPHAFPRVYHRKGNELKEESLGFGCS